MYINGWAVLGQHTAIQTGDNSCECLQPTPELPMSSGFCYNCHFKPLFPLNIWLVAAIFALPEVQFQLPAHISIRNCNKPNGSSGEYFSAPLSASEMYPTEQASVSHWVKREQLCTQEIKLTNEVDLTFMVETTQCLRIRMKRTLRKVDRRKNVIFQGIMNNSWEFATIWARASETLEIKRPRLGAQACGS